MCKRPSRYFNRGGRIENQFNSNFCAGYSSTSYLTAFLARKFGKIIEFSPLYAMQNSKEVDGASGTGTYVEDLLAEIIDQGCCEEYLYPTSLDGDFHDNKFPPISKEIDKNAEQYAPAKLKVIDEDSVDALKDAVLYNGGCVLGINAYSSYLSKYKGMYIRKPNHRQTPIGRHAIYLSGYDDNMVMEYDGEVYKGFFILNESYGTGTRSGGYVFLPYKIVEEKATGLYSMDKFMDKAYCFAYANGEEKYPNFNDDFIIEQPRYVVELVVGEKVLTVNGVRKQMTVPATVIDGRTLIPIRAVSEAFGLSVFFDGDTKTIAMTSREPFIRVEMQLGSKEVYVSKSNDEPFIVMSDIEPVLISNTTMIPVRLISEILGYDVEYNKGKITISTYK